MLPRAFPLTLLRILNGKNPKFSRAIASSLAKAEQNIEHTEHNGQQWDAFTKEFMENRIEMNSFQKILLGAGSSIAALVDPRR